MDIFWIKKTVSQFFHPVAVVLILLLLSWILLAWAWRRSILLPKKAEGTSGDQGASLPKKWFGCLVLALFFAGILILYICSSGILVNKMFYALEKQYPPLQLDQEEVQSLEPDYIVVLSAAHSWFPKRPITSRVTASSMARLVEGLRLHKQFPDSKLVITGGVMQQGWPSMAKEMGELAILLGYEGELILEERARDTRENAKLLKPVLQDKPFLLVTSGYHMPRAMGMFRGQGLRPIAASAEIKRWPRNNFKRDQLVPRAIHLSNMSKAQHEYMGLLWAKLRGQIGKAPDDDSPSQEQPEPGPKEKSEKGQSGDKALNTESD